MFKIFPNPRGLQSNLHGKLGDFADPNFLIATPFMAEIKYSYIKWALAQNNYVAKANLFSLFIPRPKGRGYLFHLSPLTATISSSSSQRMHRHAIDRNTLRLVTYLHQTQLCDSPRLVLCLQALLFFLQVN